ncbi:MAG: hypothetical protein M1836_002149 [Candelina mexicana]|nr:MAG: hypothetical protein M1836_002149 [Candelina mexicana]
MSTNEQPTTALTAQCHCKFNTHAIHVPTTSLPLPTYICHCTTSRRVSGLLFTTYISLPHGPTKFTDLASYASSTSLVRYFCSRCGAHMFGFHKPSKVWKVATGVLDRTEGIVEFKGHMWVGDTGDGGGVEWLKSIGGGEMEVWKEGAGSSKRLDYRDASLQQDLHKAEILNEHQNMKDRPKILNARCHCNGVAFSITPPTSYSSTYGASEYPDLLVPYRTSTPSTRTPPANTKWYLRSHNHKYLAGTCACHSCRLTCGFPIQTWAFIPHASLHAPNTLSQQLSFSDLGTMRSYNSSKGVTRDFCGRCGASVFWRREGREDGVVDVSVGLLDAEEGARAEEWVEWVTGRVSFAEEAGEEVLVEALVKGLRAWEESKDVKDGNNY